MTYRLQVLAGYAVFGLALVAAAAAVSTGTAAGEAAGVGILALAVAGWLVRAWACGPDMSAAERRAELIAPVMAFVIVALLVVPTLVYAGTGGTEFDDVWDELEGWAEGALGRVISVGLLVVGLAAGIVRQSIMAAVPAAGAGLALSIGPGVIDDMFTATL